MPRRRDNAPKDAFGLVSEDADLDKSQMRHGIGVVCRETKSNGRTPVMTDDLELSVVQMIVRQLL